MIFHFRCPVDPTIFPSFGPDGNGLQSIYEAFRFTESYGVIFQCNVKYCLGPCEPVSTFSCMNRHQSQNVLSKRAFDNFQRLYVIGVVNLWSRGVEGKGQQTTRSCQQIVRTVKETTWHKSVRRYSCWISVMKKTRWSITTPTSFITIKVRLIIVHTCENAIRFFIRGPVSDTGRAIPITEPCPTKASVLALGITCILLVLIYVITLFFYYLRKWMSPRKYMT